MPTAGEDIASERKFRGIVISTDTNDQVVASGEAADVQVSAAKGRGKGGRRKGAKGKAKATGKGKEKEKESAEEENVQVWIMWLATTAYIKALTNVATSLVGNKPQ